MPSVYRLNTEADSLTWVDGSSAVNSTVEFDLLPQNSSAQVGVLLRYVDENDWLYVGCDEATDNLGFCVWYAITPNGKTEIARDIAKLYAHHSRHLKVNCIWWQRLKVIRCMVHASFYTNRCRRPMRW